MFHKSLVTKALTAGLLALCLFIPRSDTAEAGGIGSVWAKNVTDSNITWAWNAPTGDYRVQPGANPAYRVCVAKGLNKLDPCLLTTKHDWNQTEFPSTGLEADKTYRVEVQCKCEKRKKNGSYKNANWRKIGTLKQSTAKEPKGGGGGSESLSVIGASETTLTVRVDYTGSKSFSFLRICYKRKYNLINNMLLQCGSTPSPWNASDDMKGWADLNNPGFPIVHTFSGLKPGTLYSLIAYGFESTSEQIGDRVVARTAGKWKPFRLMREIRDDHADLASAWLQTVETHYAMRPISRRRPAAAMHTARAGVTGIPILEWGPYAVHATMLSLADLDSPRSFVGRSLESSRQSGRSFAPSGRSAFPEGTAYFVAGNGDLETASPASAEAEVYVPASDSWHALAPMAEARRGLSLTRLPDGRILAAGGDGGMEQGFPDYAEIYNPDAGTWRATAPMNRPRKNQTATLLPDGSVLAIGGASPGFIGDIERFDPNTGSWEPIGSLLVPRDRHTATLLPDGSVLVVGGRGTAGRLKSVERFDPATGVSTLVGELKTERALHSAAMVAGCCIIVAGGQGGGGLGFPDRAERYMLDSGEIEEIGSLKTPRKSAAIVPLPYGRFLMVGGDQNRLLSSVERFDPATGEFEEIGSLSAARGDLDAMLGPDGRVLALGGRGAGGPQSSVERFDPRSEIFLHLAERYPAQASLSLEDAWSILAAEEGEDLGDPEMLLDFLAETDSPIFDAWQAETGLGSISEAGLALRDWLQVHEPSVLEGIEEEIEDENAIPAPASSKLANISTRAWVGTGDEVMIAGMIVSGGPADLLIRAIGPSLAASGVPGSLQDPELTLHDGSGAIVLHCDNWASCPGAADLGGLTPADPREAAFKLRLEPGAYTAIVRGKGGTTGVALAEVFHAGGEGQLTNISTRGMVLTDDRVMIGGIIVRDAPGKVIFRAIGPSLAGRGVPGSLQNPWFELYNGAGEKLMTCQDWASCPGVGELGALTPSDSREPAAMLLLEPGAYTVVVRGEGGGTGVALVEAFAVR